MKTVLIGGRGAYARAGAERRFIHHRGAYLTIFAAKNLLNLGNKAGPSLRSRWGKSGTRSRSMARRGLWGGAEVLMSKGGSQLPYAYLSGLSRFGNHLYRHLLPHIRHRDNLPWFTICRANPRPASKGVS